MIIFISRDRVKKILSMCIIYRHIEKIVHIVHLTY